MSFDTLNSIVTRVLFFGGFGLLGLAILEGVVNLFGYRILRDYTAGRVLEFAAILLIFVIALLLRQLREELKKGSGPS